MVWLKKWVITTSMVLHFPAEEIVLEIPFEPVDPSEELFPTETLVDDLEVPGIGTFKATMITAGILLVLLMLLILATKILSSEVDINNDSWKHLLDLKQLDLMQH